MDSVDDVQMSSLGWMIQALGPLYLIALPLAGLVSFIAAVILVTRGRGTMAALALLLFVHVPLLVGLFGAIQGLMASYSVIAFAGSTPKPSDIAEGISTALFAPLVGIVLMVPGYATAAIGAFCRAFGRENNKA